MWDWSENQVKLILIRHGATEANKEHRYLGRTDEGLSVEGREALQKEKCAGNYPDIDYVFSSPMKRCLETAELLYPDKEPMQISEWKEMDFGAFEGKNYLELQGNARYQAWIDSNGTLPFPGGEGREEFVRRCERGIHRMLAQLTEQMVNSQRERTQQTLTIGLLVHGGTIMALLSHFYGGEYFDYQVANGRGYSCMLRYNGDSIEFDVLEKI